jgi:signal peptidase I
MEPTLLNGDRVVVAKFSYGLFLPWTNSALVNWGMPNVGDVVILKNPHDNVDIVKRVIALPGDTVEVREDVVYRNGAPITHKDRGLCADLLDYLDHSLAECWEEKLDSERYLTSRAGPSPGSPPITVPPDHFFVLGDHRDHSNDSRFFGAVHKEKLKGRALSIYWSSDSEEGIRWSRLFDGID